MACPQYAAEGFRYAPTEALPRIDRTIVIVEYADGALTYLPGDFMVAIVPGILFAPYAAGCALLVVAGVPKALAPAPLARALSSVGFPLVISRSARGVAVTEVAVGVAGILAFSSLSVALVGGAYVLFTAFVVVALARGGVLSSCGCFGKADTPPTLAHVALTAGVALTALAVAARPDLGVPPRLDPTAGPAAAALAALFAFLAWQVLAVLPTLTPVAVRSARGVRR